MVSSRASRLLEDLNSAQREAVTHGTGPLLVLAGAGSGKTRVLTYRIAHLLAIDAAHPSEITAVTFTNRAAQEMLVRVEQLLGAPLEGGFLGTFHRWALGVLRRHPRVAGLPERFTIIDSDDQRALVTRVLKELELDPRTFPPRAMLSRISAAANRGDDPGAVATRDGEPGAQEVARVWRRYEELKRAVGAVDFDDMLLLTVSVLRRDDAIRRAVQRRCRYLLVDEFQDTNRPQMELLRLALGAERSLSAVGDEDQSIYRWRGAEIDNILSFDRAFPDATVVALEENYRSTQPILEVAGALIANNVRRRGKTLFTRRPGGEPVRLYVGQDERAEARWTVDRIDELHGEHALGSMAVLMRTNAQTRTFEEELTRRRIAYRVIGGLRFWQRAEVKDALAYLRLVVNPNDTLAFERVVNVPARGIGAATMDALGRCAEEAGVQLPAAARSLPEALTPRARVSLERFFRLVDEGRDKRNELEAGDFVGWLLESSGLLSLYDGEADDRVARRENLVQLAAAVAEGTSRGQSLEDFLDTVALLADGDAAAAADSVSLMTLHAAKGLEFDVVFLAGVEDGLLPHASARNDPDRVEEERRLAYVGMTRARKWLAVSAARSRFLFGQRQLTRSSPFLGELPVTAIRDVSDVPVSLDPQSVQVASPRPPSGARPPTRSTRRPIRATVVDTAGHGWRPGVRVRHKRFGTGVVLKCLGSGPQLKLVVFFDRAGRKTMVASLAQLEQL